MPRNKQRSNISTDRVGARAPPHLSLFETSYILVGLARVARLYKNIDLKY